MVKHYNTSLADDANRILNTKAGDMLSSQVNPILQPTIPITRICDIIRSASVSASASTGTLFTTPSDKDFYLSLVSFNIIKDSTCDVASGNTNLRAVINGANTDLIAIPMLTLTAQETNVQVAFPIPFKVDKNTSITLVANTFTAGNFRKTGLLAGYTMEVSK